MIKFCKMTKLSLAILFFFCANLTQSLAMAEEVKATIHNVGQGSCVTLEVENNGHPQYMIIDIGSSAYGKAIKFSQESRKKPAPTTPIFGRSGPSLPASEQRPQAISKKTPQPTEREEIKKRVQLDIREALGAKKSLDGHIHVKTIVITHPDKDHYGWLRNVISFDSEDEVKNIVLGGFPIHYDWETLTWLEKNIGKTTVFFPAMNYRPINNNHEHPEYLEILLDAILEKGRKKLEKSTGSERKKLRRYLQSIGKKKESIEKQLGEKKKEGKTEALREETGNKIYAEQAFSNHLDGIIRTDSNKIVPKELQEAFNFGENVKVYMLSVNPLHFQGKRSIVRLYDGKEDDNKESLVMKIEHKGSSMILTGDATQATINRIIDNYGDNLNFLKTDVLLASHHGSSTHGSNSLQWLDLTQPKYVLISNGLSYGHPSEEAYQRFHVASLENVRRHEVLVGKTTEQKEEGGSYNEAILHETNAAIFSTLNSGAITVNFEEGRVSLKTDKEGETAYKQEKGPEKEIDKNVSVIEEDEVIDINVENTEIQETESEEGRRKRKLSAREEQESFEE